MQSTDHFAAERARFEALRAAWIAEGRDGWWVAILRDVVVGPVEAYAEARTAALARFGGPGFMLRRIRREDRPVMLTRIAWDRRAVP